ncbi:hypothetical protein ACLOJK_011131 [Asimina triloba]
MAPKKIGYLTPSEEERSSPHNAVITRPLPVTNRPPFEDQALSNSSDPSGESPNGLSIYPLNWRPLTVDYDDTNPRHGPGCTSSPNHLSTSSFVYTEGAGREQPTNPPPPDTAHPRLSGGLSKIECSLSPPVEQWKSPRPQKGLEGPHQCSRATEALDPDTPRAQTTLGDQGTQPSSDPRGPSQQATPVDSTIK